MGGAGLFFFSFYNTDDAGSQFCDHGDTVIAASANGFWYREFSAMQVEESDSEPRESHTVQLQVIPCNDLQIHNQILQVTATIYYPGEPFILSSGYRLSGSTILYDFCVTGSDILHDQAAFFVFDSPYNVQDFYAKRDDGLNSSVIHQELEVGMDGTLKCTRLEYTAEYDSYYWHLMKINGTTNVQFNYTTTIKYLNWTDYTAHCSIVRSESCDLTFGNSFFGTPQDYCLLAYRVPEDLLQTYLYIAVETKKRYSVLVVPAALLVVGVTGLVLVVSLHCCFRYKRQLIKATNKQFHYM